MDQDRKVFKAKLHAIGSDHHSISHHEQFLRDHRKLEPSQKFDVNVEENLKFEPLHLPEYPILHRIGDASIHAVDHVHVDAQHSFGQKIPLHEPEHVELVKKVIYPHELVKKVIEPYPRYYDTHYDTRKEQILLDEVPSIQQHEPLQKDFDDVQGHPTVHREPERLKLHAAIKPKIIPGKSIDHSDDHVAH